MYAASDPCSWRWAKHCECPVKRMRWGNHYDAQTRRLLCRKFFMRPSLIVQLEVKSITHLSKKYFVEIIQGNAIIPVLTNLVLVISAPDKSATITFLYVILINKSFTSIFVVHWSKSARGVVHGTRGMSSMYFSFMRSFLTETKLKSSSVVDNYSLLWAETSI